MSEKVQEAVMIDLDEVTGNRSFSDSASSQDRDRDELQDTERGSNVHASAASAANANVASRESKHDEQRPPPPRLNAHSRNISWGMNEVMNLSPPSPHPSPRSDASTLSQSQSQSQGNIHSHADTSVNYNVNLPYQGDRHSRQTSIELPDNLGIVNPLETEAEAYLLRAIERAEADLQENSILNEVPDKAIQKMAADRRPSIDDNDNGNDNDNDDSSSVSGASSSRQTRSTLGGSSWGPSARNRQPGGKAASVRSFAQNVPRKQHRRKLTLDEQLFGLTHAMDAMHAESFIPHEDEDIMFMPSSLGRMRSNTIDSQGASTPVVPEGNEEEDQSQKNEVAPVASSFEVLVQNANVYYEQNIPTMQGNRFGGLTRRKSQRRFGFEMGSTIIDEEKSTQEEESDVEQANQSTNIGEQNGNVEANNGQPGGTPDQTSKQKAKSRWARAKAVIFDEWGFTSEVKNFIKPKQNLIRLYFQIVVIYITIPCMAAAAILFYLGGNPPTGILKNNGNPEPDGRLYNTKNQVVGPYATSVSYMLLFAVRQMVTLTFALVTQVVLIDFLAIDRGYLFKLGSRIPLFIMQARGWPFIIFFWSIFNWGLLAGSRPFFSHWLYFQDSIRLFNASNPDGELITSDWNHRILALASGISFAVACKRFSMGVFLGRQTYYRYSDKLATLMQKMLLISQVAGLSRQIASPQGRGFLRKREETIASVLTSERMDGLIDNADDDTSEIASRTQGEDSAAGYTGNMTGAENTKGSVVIDEDDRNPYTGKLSNSQKNRITRLLGAWEEPTEEIRNVEAMSIASLMHFRRALNHLRTDLPFSASFGPAGNREDCVASCQHVFRRLLIASDHDEVLNFEVLALLGAKVDGTLDQEKLMEIIKLFRPDRDGTLSMVHFVRSVDKVYKEIRMLRASVHNSTKVDGQFEAIFNFMFYALVMVVILNTLGFDPLALFVSISGLVLGFAFMIGTASSKYFEGLLFILVRRPYGIGDCIHVSDVNADTSYTGSAFWYVEDITLFSTHVRYFFTNERASLSNGALANSRIINSSKSYNAGLYHYLKFPLDVPYEKVKIFHEALETFVRNRPREWIGLSSFRATQVNANEGYIEYIVCVDHRESWASWTLVRTSQSDLMGFGVELAKKLDIVYKQPILPVDLRMNGQQLAAPPEPGTLPSETMPPMVDSLRVSPRDVSGHGRGHHRGLSDFDSIAAQFPHREVAKQNR